ncbi:YgjV family protein [Schumannella soli]|uniref:YgjV family protein n=1 Tax=Schumannella soli TaxID=2590779 RepID=A0A506YAG2_9MICO|nr:YgjV family protein [Schumannella soli]TPW77459.1 hypothetical protein FJ657_01895 [Schumannella soli]
MTQVAVEAVGWAGSLLLIVSLVQTRIVRLRWINLFACGLLLAYNLWLPSWPMVAMNAALVVINVVNLVRLRRAGRSVAAESASTAAPTSPV